MPSNNSPIAATEQRINMSLSPASTKQIPGTTKNPGSSSSNPELHEDSMRGSPDMPESFLSQKEPGDDMAGTVAGEATSAMLIDQRMIINPEYKINEIKVKPSDSPPLITEEMMREEEALMVASEREEEIQREKEAELKAQLAAEEQEKRLRRLKHLLTQSKFYAKFIEQKLTQKLPVKASDSQGSSSGSEESTKKGRRGRAKPKVDVLANDKALLDTRDGQSSVAPLALEKQAEGTKVTPLGLVVSCRQPDLFEGGVMRDYQLDGYEWLRLLYLNGVNGILADEMGLGKTIQCIALICHMVEQGMANPFLVIGPLSTLSNWVSEFQRFAPQVPVVLYHGSQPERKALWSKIRARTNIRGNVTGVFPVVITSYEVAMKDLHPLQDRHWEMIIIDEGHRIKNFKCKLVRELKRYSSNNRLLLTGTPLQNNLTELWSLLNYLLPEIFSELTVFESWFEATEFSSIEGNAEATSKKIVQMEERDNVVSTLHQILHPFMLRRVKTDVELNIPPKKELLVFTPLTTVQDEMYRALLSKSIHDLLAPKEEAEEAPLMDTEGPSSRKRRRRTCTQGEKHYAIDELSYEEYEERFGKEPGFEDETFGSEFAVSFRARTQAQGYLVSVNPCSTVMDMRKVVNHPYLLRFPVIPGTKELVVNEELVNSSGKMLVLDAMLAKLKKQGHKVLIFSQMCMMLDLIEEYMIMRGHTYCRLDGSRSVFDRQMNINKFNTDPNMFAFLVSTRAGGLGINLTGADTVIIYDSDWNPQCDLQAQDRCHRIGQTRPVVVYRLTTDGTIDRRMVELATGKRRLEKIVIKKGRFQGIRNSLVSDGSGISAQELLDLLNSKDYVKSICSNGFIYSDDELEILLDRSDLMNGQETPAVGTKGPSHLYEVI